jgi:hypothetical protein
MKNTLLILSFLFCLTLSQAQGQTVKISALPATNAVASQDNVLINSTNPGTGLFTSTRTTVSTLANAVTNLAGLTGASQMALPVIIGNGGTGGTVAGTARTNLGAAGTNDVNNFVGPTNFFPGFTFNNSGGNTNLTMADTNTVAVIVGSTGSFFANPAHSIAGEFGMTANNRFALTPDTSGRHLGAFQYGYAGLFNNPANGEGGVSPFYILPSSHGASANLTGYSQLFWLQSSYWNTLAETSVFIGDRAESMDTNGNTRLNYYTTNNGSLGPLQGQAAGTQAGLEIWGGPNADSAGAVTHGRVTSDLATGSGNSLVLDFDGANSVDYNLSGNVTITVQTNTFNRTNQVDDKTINLLGGPTTLTVSAPAGWIWYGTNGALTTIIGTNMAHLLVSRHMTTGVSTNYFATYTTGTYTNGIDPDASAFIIIAGISSPNEILAIQNLVIGMKALGIWHGCFQYAYPLCGGTATSCKWNLVNTNVYNLTDHGASYSSNGVAGNGTSSYADTGFNPATATNSLLTLNNAEIGGYSKFTIGTAGSQSEMGVVDSSVASTIEYEVNAGGASVEWRGPNDLASPSAGYAPGIAWLQRTASGTKLGYFGSGTPVGNTTTSVSLPNNTIYLCAWNFNGPGQFSTNAISFAWASRAMTTTELNGWSNLLVQFETTKGTQ